VIRFAIPFVLLILAALAILPKLLKGSGSGTVPARHDYTRRQPLTAREIEMYRQLEAACPDHHILAQVAMSTLLQAAKQATRNTYDRKVCDFVVCDHEMRVVLIIELDDASHRGKGDQDAARDAMLSSAGYKTLRFDKVPTVQALRVSVCP
jgi:very-short-patch-repair endonuclease